MRRPRFELATTAAISAPGLAALGGLGAGGLLPISAGLAAAGSVVVLAAGLAWAHARSVGALTAYAESLGRDGPPPEPPTPQSPALPPGLPRAVATAAAARHARETAWRVDSERLRTLIRALPDPLFLLTPRQRVVLANAAARELTGDDPAGRDLAVVVRTPEVLNAVTRVVRQEARDDHVEFTIHGQVERIYAARVTALPGPGPDDSAAVLVLHDVTAIRRAERMRADFVANASHELRTPLSSLLGFVETLEGPASGDPEAAQRFLPIMRGQAQRMANVLDDLLSLSRIELEASQQPTGRVELAGILDSVTESLSVRAEAKEMALAITGTRDLPPVQGEREQLTQVFQNLIDNALKYGHPETTVAVHAEQAGRVAGVGEHGGAPAVAVHVVDAGEGVPREHIPRLTERFYRVDKARSRDMGGTGLGLAIVKHILARHRGRLEIASEEGVGSRFTVYLPTQTLRV